MNRSLLGMISVLVFLSGANLAFAQDTSDYTAALNAAKAARDTLNATIGTQQVALINDQNAEQAARQVLNELLKEYNAKKQAFDASAGTVLGHNFGTGDRQAKQEMDDAQAKLEEQQKLIDQSHGALVEASQKVSATQKALDATDPAKSATLIAMRAAQDGFKSQLIAGNLLEKFNTLDKKNLSLQSRLQLLSMKMDVSNMGTYIEDKMGKMLGSQAFCNAAGSCLQDHKKYVPKFNDMKEIFPTITKSQTNYSSGSSSGKQ